ncbi:MAG: LacI family DNA-binding transcriptional regulator [Lachnospiraceae bacterium]|nr:LacI family DNA-binding transcriptional regulator [Lachnospiraceae bacterium]MDY5742497.1 LacI family DNA-binding transcriptional regulator [Lachnospiraceae bacterium]
MKRVTMQEIADAAGVSRVTVSNALNQNGHVSEALRKKIYALATKMGYARSLELNDGSVAGADVKKVIALAVARPNSSVFWLNIIHSIARILSRENISLMYTYLPGSLPESAELPAELRDGSISGLIALNIYDIVTYEKLHRLSVPKVFLDTPGGFDLMKATGDIVYIGGRVPERLITLDLLKKGNRRIGFIGDINYASTNYARFQGYMDAMREYGVEPEEQFMKTTKIAIGKYEDDLYAFLGRLMEHNELPDAFVCVSDYVAHFVIRFLEEHGLEVPRDIRITGFDGNMEYLHRPEDFLTTAVVDVNAIGKKMVRQLQNRMEDEDMPSEVAYLRTKVLIGRSSGEQR